MKIKIVFAIVVMALLSCADNVSTPSPASLIGTWRLIKGTLADKGDTIVTDYTVNTSFIKIINNTHFAFFQHDLKKGKDSGAVFVAGGGRYSLSGNQYIEHLEYCSDRNWEDNDFKFTFSIAGDTLVITGVEKVESAGVNRVNTEKYVRVKNSDKK
jgi:hypothetical protein